MKCQVCTQEYPSKYYFKTPKICSDCYISLPKEEQENLQQISTQFLKDIEEFREDISTDGQAETQNGSARTHGDSQGKMRQATGTGWMDVAIESSILGTLAGLVVFLHSVAGIGPIIGKVLGFITFILGMTMFPSWKGKSILGIPVIGAVGALVNGILMAIFK